MIAEKPLNNFYIYLFETKPDQFRTLRSHLCVAGAHVFKFLSAEYCADATTILMSKNNSVVIVDLDTSEKSGFETAKILRTRGFTQTILGFSAELSSDLILSAQSFGVTDCVVKPSNHEACDLILEVSKRQFNFLESQLKNDKIVAQVLPNFISGLSGRFCSLLTAYNKQEWDAVAFTAHALRGTAANFGYPTITDLCGEIETRARNERSISPESVHNLSSFLGQAMLGYAQTVSDLNV